VIPKHLSPSLRILPPSMGNLKISSDIIVKAKPVYIEKESSMIEPKHVFVYFIEITNNSSETVQLLRRHWDIEDSGGDNYIVEGDGVIGQKPIIKPGETHRYQSFCVLKGFTGAMSGWYEMTTTEGDTLNVPIPKFYLNSYLLN
jgi:ApaG protein